MTEAGRDRRQHRRHEAVALVEVAGARWHLVDISLGGFAARVDDTGVVSLQPVAGRISGRIRGEPYRIDFSGRIVRLEAGTGVAAVRFDDLPDESLDRLMHVLALLEQDWAAAVERLDRQRRLAELRRKLARAGAIAAALAVAVAAAASLLG